MKNKENKRRMSKKARKEFNDLRRELKKANPDPELINHLLNGDKYIYPVSRRLNEFQSGFQITIS